MATEIKQPESRFCDYVLITGSLVLLILTFPISIFLVVCIVKEYERVVIFRLGRIVGGKPKGPGLFFVLLLVDRIVVTDMRTKIIDVIPQEILTKDSVTVTVDAVVFYRIIDPKLATTAVECSDTATFMLAKTTLRNCLGTMDLRSILQSCSTISDKLKVLLDPPTDIWGVKVEHVEIKDIRLPLLLQRSMASEAEASRVALAKVILGEGEKNAAKALGEAADILAQSPAALQLRYFQTLNSISAESNSTILFPLPVQLLGNIVEKKAAKK